VENSDFLKVESNKNLLNRIVSLPEKYAVWLLQLGGCASQLSDFKSNRQHKMASFTANSLKFFTRRGGGIGGPNMALGSPQKKCSQPLSFKIFLKDPCETGN
jgi:hypothetical protein